MHELCTAAIAGDGKRAAEIHLKLLPLHKHLFAEPNPIPVKWALARMGRCGGALRLPLTPLSDALHGTLEQALRDSGVL
jgi:4-hydroxy-tetrahydrodipicolinate synthase